MTEHIEIPFLPFVHERDLVHLDGEPMIVAELHVIAKLATDPTTMRLRLEPVPEQVGDRPVALIRVS